MATRRSFLASLGIGLFSAAAAWADPPGIVSMRGTATDAVNTVRQYLALRATNEWTKASTLVFALEEPQPSFDQLLKVDPSAGDPFAKGLPPVLTAVSALFLSTGNRLSYQYQVIGIAPEDTHTVLVSAQPPQTGADKAVPPLLLRIVTAPDPLTGSPRIKVISSYQKTDPIYFERAREHARQAVSLSNLKQLSLGLLTYMLDHGQRYPLAGNWADAITPYLTAGLHTHQERQQALDLLFHDPSAPDSQRWSYAFNSNLSGLLLSQVDKPATTVLLFESSANAKNAADTGESIPRPGRHSGGTDYAKADGHCLWVPDSMPPAERRTSLSFSPTGN